MSESDGKTLLESAALRGRLPGGSTPPLAETMRPRRLEELSGQVKILGPRGFLRGAIEKDRIPSLILWGPPGVGKTSLARVIAETTAKEFVSFSAVLGGVPELREVLKKAAELRRFRGQATIVFVDEIHRFNKAQQDALLPHVESGAITLIGATTENPSFAVNAAILSRTKTLRLEALEPEELETLLSRALSDPERGLGARQIQADPPALALLSRAARGDARRALGLLETAVDLLAVGDKTLTEEAAQRALSEDTLLYDKAGDQHYDLASALIKSLRGSDPDAAIYYLMRMLEAGEDPLFLLRRLIIFASEDVGNADPRALPLVVAADAAFRRIGMPEGLYPMAHACLYLASCAKSGAVGKAFSRAKEAISRLGALPVPLHLRNPVTRLMREEGHGAGYRYAHDHPEGYVPGETYLPAPLLGSRFYEPTDHGLEKAIGERLERIRGEAKSRKES